MRALFLAIAVLVSAQTANAQMSCQEMEKLGRHSWICGKDEEKYRTIIVDAVIIARVASRVCGTFGIDENLEAFDLKTAGYTSWSELPAERVERILKRFSENLAGTCAYAWATYGSQQQVRRQYLYLKNPF